MGTYYTGYMVVVACIKDIYSSGFAKNPLDCSVLNAVMHDCCIIMLSEKLNSIKGFIMITGRIWGQNIMDT